MLRRRLLVLAAVPLAAGAAACGEAPSTSGLPVYTPRAVASAGAAPSPSAVLSPSAEPAATPSGPADTVSVTEGQIQARGQGKLVARAWVSYWRERIAAQHELDAERPGLLAVASGDALLQVRDGVAGLRGRGLHMIGTAEVSVSRIRVGEAGARITSCLETTTTEVDAQLRQATPPVPRFGVDGTAERAGDSWRITQVQVRSTGSC